MVLYENWIAKYLLFNGCHTITLGPFILTSKSKEQFKQHVLNHELIHVAQWCEVSIVSLIILLLLVLMGISAWWLMLSVAVYYVQYAIEWGVRRCIGDENSHEDYREVSYEQEAYGNEHIDGYYKTRKHFSWIGKLKTKN